MEKWLIILTSSGVASMVGIILQPIVEWIKSKIENDKIRNERKYQEENAKTSKKEEVYLQTIEYLMRIGNGLDISKYDVQRSPKFYSKEIDNINELGFKISSKIRLYATDDIFELYYYLSKYGQYAYSETRISKMDREIFFLRCNELSRMMSDDLGIDTKPHIKKIMCPKCNTIHELDDSKCPKCGIDMVEAMKIQAENLEKNMKVNENTEV